MKTFDHILKRALLAWLAPLLVALSLAACSAAPAEVSSADAAHHVSSVSASQAEESSSAAGVESTSESAAEQASASAADPSQAAQAAAFDLGDIAPYAGDASVSVNGNVPFFTSADRARSSFEEYSPLDKLGRCGAAFALVGTETMPTEPRGSIGSVKPSGWQTVRYDGLVDGNYLYNRCHLIGYQLTGVNADERNLITGTRSMNTQGMLPYEDRVASYVKRTGNHVLYRATPVFEGTELVARGVLLEAESVEDEGAGVRFCAWCYNVEPGIEIDYATGESRRAESGEAAQAASAVQPAADAADAADAEASAVASDANVQTYILNTSRHKFHKPDCSSVNDMAEHNKRVFEGTRDEAISQGYQPCKRCNP